MDNVTKKPAAKSRAYKLTHNATGAVRLIEAANPAQAYRHVARDDYTLEVPSALESLRIAQETGAKIERAGEE